MALDLALKIENLEGVPEHFHEAYEPVTDDKGKPVANGGYALRVKGMVGKEKLDEFRDNNTQLQKEKAELTEKVNGFADIDLEKYNEALSTVALVESGDLKSADSFNKKLADETKSIRETHKTELQKLGSSLGELKEQNEALTKSVASNEILKSVASVVRGKVEVLPTAQDDFHAAILREFSWSFEDKVPQVIDASGHQRYSETGAGNMTVDEWVTEFIHGKPHLFKADEGSGSQGSGERIGRAGVRVLDKGKLTIDDLAKIQQGKATVGA